ncbi:MAG: pyridoxamine 5'-phosphate oxidase family protein [Alphaproteobacteria bacterium]|jgi:hypothetical protein|nr:pyridoxamine 5'-phosphate oxidase family protein [Alphaproteobacteria bacterium]MDP6588100.1 pyridoxamine 5'-phosphate oxidase family protein [Alphaproteobacteria bacterium]MDP6816779.1 pyridoxamine 5'-phosphate oxidase family protein [Alphaproteobacteria bacterium]|tara:strand:- start:943 stop:1347 length:405 start_codon:yes stop_codon:yes gene_type:complete
MLPEEIKPAMQGMVPSTLVSCSLEGEPNTCEISQVWYVDENHVALSHQFFNKTHRNIRANPFAFVAVRDLEALREWHLELQYERSETEGDLFDDMDMKLEAIASMTGMSGIFKLLAADIYTVLSVRESNSRGAV